MNQTDNHSTHAYFEVAPQVWGLRDVFVNLYMVQNSSDKNWVLIDTGLKSGVARVKKMATQLFGDTKPKAIILTHGHFDHVGGLQELAEFWNVPVYAHYLELPYLTGKSAYPPADPVVGGGLMAYISCLYPNKPINMGGLINVLPEDGAVPGLKDWRYLHTPGHAPGHISLFRDTDNVLIAGDAIVTTQAESGLATLTQKRKLSGPPAYFTYDWAASSDSVKKLLMLAPEVIATGHGRPMQGKEMRKALHQLHEHFYDQVVPARGRYVNEPAVADANGVLYVPPRVSNPLSKWVLIGSVAALTATALIIGTTKKKKKVFQF